MFGRLFYFLTFIHEISSNHTLTPAQKLYNDMFRHYNRALRPTMNQSNPVSVSIHFWFKQILKVDEIDQTMTVYLWLEEFWTDEYLSWNPKDYDNIDVMHIPAESIWKPDILVYNGASMNTKENELETNAVIKHTGEIMLFKAVITDIACNLDMTYFPFDQQVCFIMLASWSHDGSKIHLNMRPAKSHLDFYISNTEWELKDFKAQKNLRQYECCPDPYPEILYYFVLERNPAYYILSLIIPSAFITVVTIVGFFTPHSSTGETTEKVSLGVTALLSLAIILLMVADKMPATSKVMPLIGKYYIGLIFLIFLAACTTTVTLTIQLAGNGTKPPKPEFKYILFKIAKFFWISTEDIDRDEPKGKYSKLDDSSETAFLLRSQSSYQVEDYGVVSSEHLTASYPVNFQRLQAESVANKNPRNATGGSVRRRENHPVAATSNNPPSSQAPSEQQKLRAIFEKIETTVDEIGEELRSKQRQMKIKREWAFVTRVVERFLMIFFIFLLLFFAIIMLSSRGAPLLLNDKVMKKILSIS